MSTKVKSSSQFPESPTDQNNIPQPLELEATILDQLPAFVYLVAEDYSIQYTNRAFTRQFGSIATSGLCHALIRAKVEPCDDCPLTRVFSDRQQQVLIYDDPIRGQIYELHYSPYFSESCRLYALVLGIDITNKCRENYTCRRQICDENIVQICSHCKSIHTKSGIWQKIEHYMSSKSNIRFSHGICPLCMQKHHPDIK